MKSKDQKDSENIQYDKMVSLFKKYTSDCQTVGIGMGKTMRNFANVLSYNFTYIPSSNQTSQFLIEKITTDMQNLSTVDVYFDSADYYDTQGNLIKGGGGALTREKLLMKMAKKSVILVDKSKLVKSFEKILVPIEILKESYMYFMRILKLHKLRGKLRLVQDISPFITDNFNFIIDVEFNLEFLKTCKNITGVIEHGYFSNDLDFEIEEI